MSIGADWSLVKRSQLGAPPKKPRRRKQIWLIELRDQIQKFAYYGLVFSSALDFSDWDTIGIGNPPRLYAPVLWYRCAPPRCRRPSVCRLRRCPRRCNHRRFLEWIGIHSCLILEKYNMNLGAPPSDFLICKIYFYYILFIRKSTAWFTS